MDIHRILKLAGIVTESNEKIFKVNFHNDHGDWEIYLSGADEDSAIRPVERQMDDIDHIQEISELPDGMVLRKRYRPQETIDTFGNDEVPDEEDPFTVAFIDLLAIVSGNTSPDLPERISGYIINKMPQKYWGWAASLAEEEGISGVLTDVSMRKGEMGIR